MALTLGEVLWLSVATGLWCQTTEGSLEAVRDHSAIASPRAAGTPEAPQKRWVQGSWLWPWDLGPHSLAGAVL